MYKKNQYKFCILVALAFYTAFIMFHFVTWKCYTQRILDLKRYPGGDLTRTGYVPELKNINRKFVETPKKHIPYENYTKEKIDIITIGDSFSNEDGGAKQHYYQDFIATINGKNVLNITSVEKHESGEIVFRNPLLVLIQLVNSGFIDKVKPKAVIVESVERSVLERFAKEIDFEVKGNIEDVTRKISFTKEDHGFSKFITNANYKYYQFKAKYARGEIRPNLHVMKMQLDAPYFSNSYADQVLFTYLDIVGIEFYTHEKLLKTNDNINKASRMLSKSGVKLYFMPAVDKYDLYYDHIRNNKFPKSLFFEDLRKLPKEYELIDTKMVLNEEIKRGVKDIFWQDDTHWSWKASEAIFKHYLFK